MSDDLAELLQSSEEGDDTPPDKALLEATQGIVRTQACWRSVRRWVSWPLVFAMGLAVGWLIKPTPSLETRHVDVVRTDSQSELEAIVLIPSAMRLELQAELAENRTEAARLYRAAGDTFLNESRDCEQALRCYRLYFQHAGIEGQHVAPGDSWLLHSLKISNSKDPTHAN